MLSSSSLLLLLLPFNSPPYPSLHSFGFLVQGLSTRYKIQGPFDRSSTRQAAHYRCAPPRVAQNAPFKDRLSSGPLYDSPLVLEEMPLTPSAPGSGSPRPESPRPQSLSYSVLELFFTKDTPAHSCFHECLTLHSPPFF